MLRHKIHSAPWRLGSCTSCMQPAMQVNDSMHSGSGKHRMAPALALLRMCRAHTVLLWVWQVWLTRCQKALGILHLTTQELLSIHVYEALCIIIIHDIYILRSALLCDGKQYSYNTITIHIYILLISHAQSCLKWEFPSLFWFQSFVFFSCTEKTLLKQYITHSEVSTNA